MSTSIIQPNSTSLLDQINNQPTSSNNLSTRTVERLKMPSHNNNKNMAAKETVKPAKQSSGKRKAFKTKPRIALNLDINRGKTTVYQFNRAYINAILSAGGIPIVIPPSSQRDMLTMLKGCDGVLLIGGHDYNPALYGETPSPTITALDHEREEFDLRFIKHVVSRTTLPVLGICGGMQLLNIHFGGSLVQDIETVHPGLGEEHRSTIKQPYASHPVALKAGGKLRQIYGRRRLPFVVSSHHQALKVLGQDLQLECSADDGIPEGLSHSKRDFLVGVQWHPEQDYNGNKRLFRSLIKAAIKHSQT